MVKEWLRKKISSKFPDIEFDILTPPSFAKASEGKPDLGDYSVNLAFIVAKRDGISPMEAGKNLIGEFSGDKEFSKKFSKIQFVPPGFINFYLSEEFLRLSLETIIKEGDKFGDSEAGKGTKINLEFVSANPTGPLTVGNARSASFGDTLGNIFKKTGYEVRKEYYINDVGNQVNKLAESVKLRMLELKGEKVEFGPDLYQGEYVKEIAKEFLDKVVSEKDIPGQVIKAMTDGAKSSAKKMGVEFDEWFPESRLHESGEVKEVLAELELRGFIVEEDGAKWLKINDDQKAVLVKSDGSTTYLLNDIAYTKNKFERGFTSALNIWGADHHGDIIRLKTGVAALGYDPDRLEILLHQFVSIKEKGELQKMSKRAGRFVLFDELLAEVGKDAVRFFFLTRDLNTHMEFDIDLAKKQSKENPVFYIQYAFARLNSVFAKAEGTRTGNADRIKEEEEFRLLKDLIKLPEIIEDISQNYQVHHLARYALNLAGDFHKFYEKHHIIQENDTELQSARLLLARGVHMVLRICLDLMGLSAPERM
ncbi:MAG: arginine--tRNA ligase [Candidatus Yanofskybacteria bacterium RIFCSPLOWO2_02_FULL_43_10]|uniref:Arginine--tRNA ligase n=1 Tax=Candidatus Yanofskybacteria bacterium RIFCSPLOWO2_12_FULL_43_11b TaxID=1802710 RepID=A0A1F8HA37_9BACT|nr:MAG: arginine--tRNA ligase [Candidatus Yanofskybacteria bacterium RIFCSPHIGHO2_01_FULL_43_32]OGN11865.1 MAG: arginine--tRNA ligase [Candidatus Yanofskybacteria bacterium RIFCSPHIGHO2_02_FULL_43_12]OGN18076.1 MAG: arginine--tRNA ligase [Candidatus Yanofskybacteria bacterium RIFCSPHIGHO2_12_FULL_43_11]OGN25337.1 MAG: arginine--tRNA ligase [Candidatus Yanofskybacteria bacterium RIFCSPLOWO2_01_FULL_43_46]OGN28621.1 MAG: arginine--tRNA ligase [Candidatus Yanofskybacteria bacterium RIFCSPLOWO2_02_